MLVIGEPGGTNVTENSCTAIKLIQCSVCKIVALV